MGIIKMKLIEFLAGGGQIFDSLENWPEWLTSDIRTAVQGQLIDYAMRTIQPRLQLLAHELDTDLEGIVQIQVKNRIARNNYKYATLLATEGFEYNPIENYSMTETETNGHTKGQQVNTDLHGHSLTRTHSNTDTLTLNTSDARTSGATISGSSSATEGSRTDTDSKSVYGYNSANAVPSESGQAVKGQQQNTGTSSSQSSGSDTLLRTGTEANAHTGTITDANSGTDTHTEGSRTDSGSRSLTRAGNIGTVTAQDMVSQEREIAEFSFLGILTADLVNSFCLGVM
jgi:hypothetical protein